MGRAPPGASELGVTQVVKWLGRLVSPALILGSLWYFDANPRILLFTFIFITVVQILQIKWFMHLGRSGRYRPLIETWTRPPTEAETNWAKRYVRMKDAATDLRTLLFLIGTLSLFAFMLAHINREQALDFSFETFIDEVLFALALTAIYLVESLVLRETAMDLDESEAMNFHYGSTRITVLALAVLFAGAGVAFLQMSEREVSPWVIMGPLIVTKHLFESRKGG